MKSIVRHGALCIVTVRFFRILCAASTVSRASRRTVSLDRMGRVIVHRGPDGEGRYEAPDGDAVQHGDAPPEHHRPRGRLAADLQRGQNHRRLLQRRNLQLRRVARGAGEARPLLPHPQRHRVHRPRLRGVGHRGRAPADERHVRLLHLRLTPEGILHRARPLRAEAALLSPAQRPVPLRQRGQEHPAKRARHRRAERRRPSIPISRCATCPSRRRCSGTSSSCRSRHYLHYKSRDASLRHQPLLGSPAARCPHGELQVRRRILRGARGALSRQREALHAQRRARGRLSQRRRGLLAHGRGDDEILVEHQHLLHRLRLAGGRNARRARDREIPRHQASRDHLPAGGLRPAAEDRLAHGPAGRRCAAHRLLQARAGRGEGPQGGARRRGRGRGLRRLLVPGRHLQGGEATAA